MSLEAGSFVNAKEFAVELHGVDMSYKKRFKKPFVALTDVHLKVAKGNIYGLLGPSGCGKTTLLRCILGKFSLDNGYILVFGKEPGSPNSGIPGKRVGYMPQELALFQEFTIKETFQYFGRLLSMISSNVEERTKFLIQFLKLPEETRIVRNLSGGQQRRMSFAASLLHQPDLLILDEPTVGMDPVLRASIWEHLLTISANDKTTIIITTHYIEEARKAHTVGLMRSGRVLIESSPDQLLSIYKQPTLEDVFFRLCIKDQHDEIKTPTSFQDANKTLPVVSPTKSKRNFISWPFIRPGPMSALCYKHFIRLWRNPGFLIMQFFVPIMQIVLFGLAIGKDPHNLEMAIVNNDGQHYGASNGYGASYIEHLNKEIITEKFYNTSKSALTAVQAGKAWGAILIGENFTNALKTRYEMGPYVDDRSLNESTIDVYLDMTNQQVALILKKELVTGFQSFVKDVSRNISSDANSNSTNFMINFGTPIYGSQTVSYNEFVAPGVVLSIIYLMAMALTAFAFVMERKEGLLDRSWVSGARAIEVMLSHVVVESIIMFVQAGLVLAFTIYVINIPCKGPLQDAIFLVILQGFCGMALGLFISSLCEQENTAAMLILGMFYPNLLLSGVLWPVQGMPTALRYVSYALPLTYAKEALCVIMSKGWAFVYGTVWLGYVVTGAWSLILYVLSAVILHMD